MVSNEEKPSRLNGSEQDRKTTKPENIPVQLLRASELICACSTGYLTFEGYFNLFPQPPSPFKRRILALIIAWRRIRTHVDWY